MATSTKPSTPRRLELVVWNGGIERALDLTRQLSRHNNSIVEVLACETCTFINATFCDYISEAANGKN